MTPIVEETGNTLIPTLTHAIGNALVRIGSKIFELPEALAGVGPVHSLPRQSHKRR